MPAGPEELLAWVHGLLDGACMPDTLPVWADGSKASAGDLQEITALVRYEAGRRAEQRAGPARRRSLALLRQFLTPTQRAQLRACQYFDVESPSGLRYRFWPLRARMALLERHGKRWYKYCTFCLHPEDALTLPNPDITLAQLLVLSADEEEFLEEAHAIPAEYHGLWDGEYRRHLRQAREERKRSAGELGGPPTC